MSLTDVELHRHADVGAPILYWLAEGHESARAGQEGILFPWAMLGLGLASTDGLHSALPPQKVHFSKWVRGKEARRWRGYTREIILAWRDPFWASLARGVDAGILELDGNRVCTANALKTAQKDSWPWQVRKKARGFGATIGGEDNDARVSAAIGVDFVP